MTKINGQIMGIFNIIHHLKKIGIFVILTIFSTIQVQLTAAPEFPPKTTPLNTEKKLVYYDFVYEPQIHTVQFYRGNDPLSYPFLYLGDPTPVTLEFDELIPRSASESNLYVTVANCNEYWEPTDIIPIEFLEGFNSDRIWNYTRSENTTVPYVHYSYQFPGDNVRFKKSGNYLLKVYRDGDEDDLVITRRFIVADNKVAVIPDMGRSVAASQRNRIQRVDFTVNLNNLDIMDPRQDLMVVMLQNGRWDNAIFGIEPMFIRENILDYQFNTTNEFQGGNEFRPLDIRSFRYYTERMKNVEIRNDLPYIELYMDEPRRTNKYFSEQDINGSYIVEVQEWNNSDYQADYAMVSFKLEAGEPFTDGDVYVMGAFTDWNCLDKNKMDYNPTKFRYECEMLMKQGYYNYEYAVLTHKEYELDEARLEGSHFETENYYTILVYKRDIFGRTAELLGISHVNYYDR